MKKVLASIILILFVTVVSAQKTYILCGKLIDTESGKIEKKKTILVEGNKIVKIFNGKSQWIHPAKR